MTNDQYLEAMAEILLLCAADPSIGTPKADRLLQLVDEVTTYEREHYPEWFTSRCPWCGLVGPGFEDTPQPADYCDHSL